MSASYSTDFQYFQIDEIEGFAFRSYKYLQQYRDWCYSQGFCLGFTDCQKIQDRQRISIEQCKSCRAIFGKRIRVQKRQQDLQQYRERCYSQGLCLCLNDFSTVKLKIKIPIQQCQYCSIVFGYKIRSQKRQQSNLISQNDDVAFEDINFRLPQNFIQRQADQPLQEEDYGQSNHHLDNHNSHDPILQQQELSQNYQKTASAKGYIIRDIYKDIVQGKHPELQDLCYKHGNSCQYESLISFCKRQIKATKKYYIAVKLFEKELQQENSVRALILAQFFIEYLERYKPSIHIINKVCYKNQAKKLRNKIISIQKKQYSRHSEE